MEMIGEFWSRGGEKFSGDTGEVKSILDNHVILFQISGADHISRDFEISQ